MPKNRNSRRSLRAKPSRRRIVLRWVLWSLLVVVLVVGGLGTWIGVRAFEAKGELEQAQALISVLKEQAVAFDLEGANGTLDKISTRTEHAIELTTDPVWMAGEKVPFAGPNLTAFRQLAGVTDDVVTDVVSPLLGVAGGLNPATLTPKDGAIDLQPIIDAVPALVASRAGVEEALTTSKAIDTSATIDQIGAARGQISGLLESVVPLLDLANQVVPVIAPAMGSEGPRTYAIMFQNPAESRALGGTALSFAVMKVDAGRISLAQTIPAGFSNFSSYPDPVVAPPDGVEAMFKDSYATFIANATLRPSFPDAARITQEMWNRQFGYTLDGIVSIDPVALSYVLRATDPIPLSSGDVLTPESLVPLLLNTVYQRFNSGNVVKDNVQQDAVYGEAVGAVFARLTSGPLNPQALIAAITQGVTERRIMISSARENETALLGQFGMTGELPVSDAAIDRVGVYFEDNVGSKLNYYLHQSVHLAQAACRADGRQTYRVTVDLSSGLDPATVSSLSPSIGGQWKREKIKRGDQRLFVMLYAPPGTTIVSKTTNGQPTKMDAFHDTDYPVSRTRVTVPAGGAASVSFDIVAAEPGAKGLEALVTPMVNATGIVVDPLNCATVPAG